MKLSRILGAVSVVVISLASFVGGYYFGCVETETRLTKEHEHNINQWAATIGHRDNSPLPFGPSCEANTHTDDNESQ